MDWLSAFGFDKLDLYFETACEGMDGECFHYSVYFDAPMTDEKKHETMEAVERYFAAHYPEGDAAESGLPDNYTGDRFAFEQEDHLDVELDLGNVRPDKAFQDGIIQDVLNALNTVPGIRKVIVNEGCDDYC